MQVTTSVVPATSLRSPPAAVTARGPVPQPRGPVSARLLKALAGPPGPADWPGPLVVRRAALPAGYDGDALFENLELVRTAQARGGRERPVLDLYVRRRPPTSAHFRGQRVQQAYDSFAQPGRLAAELAVVPLALAGELRPGRG